MDEGRQLTITNMDQWHVEISRCIKLGRMMCHAHITIGTIVKNKLFVNIQCQIHTKWYLVRQDLLVL